MQLQGLSGPFDIQPIKGGAAAVEHWRELRIDTLKTGLYPLILADDDGLEDLALGVDDVRAAGVSRAELLADATPDRIARWAEVAREEVSDMDEGIEYPPRGDFPSNVSPPNSFAALWDRTGELRATVPFTLLPAPNGWEALLEIGFGDWNTCPPPSVHAAYLRDWNARFGAELVVVGRDTLEFHVARPPLDRQSAMVLAEEMFWYCADIVDQGTGTIEALAANLLNASVWFFWWD